MSKNWINARNLVLIILQALLTHVALAQNVGDCVRLEATSQLGVPLHASAGDPVVSIRLTDATIVKVDSMDQATGWLHVTADSGAGWVIRRYLGDVVDCSPAAPAGPTGESYTVGCWNLEHFDGSSTRGFPENGNGGPTYGPHSQADLATIASVIEALNAKLLILEEVGGREVQDDDGDEVSKSEVLERLINVLGSNNYGYAIASSGDAQRIAILYDKRAVRLNSVCEADFPNIEVNGKGLFDRQPLLAHATFLRNGQPMNDLVVVGVHLASGQQHAKNHDQAMKMLVDFIAEQRTQGVCVPQAEMDVFIAGDFNANRFDSHKETFWAELEGNGWDVLADDGTAYSPTRLSGVPLALNRSQIDYVIVSAGPHGLQGDEVTAAMATVHKELIGTSANDYRAHISDHLPVTVDVKVMSDTD
jgi:endonuclease/exonuclease/phosphatase family metal-dependent hydrolase